jgi:vitamin B12/bleomycin/antimicrobial peptide transport system ATP-binding/permease protein
VEKNGMHGLTAAIDTARQKPGAADRSLLAQIACLLHALARSSHHRLRLGLLAVLLVVVVCAVAYGQIRLNEWNGTLTDTLAQRAFGNLGSEIILFLVIVCGLLLLVVSQTWLQETIKIRLREWLTHDLLDNWLAPKRPYLLAHAGEVGVHPDQYIQADARHLAELSASLAFGLLQSTLLLFSFSGVLWILSDQVVFRLDDGGSFTIPGYMVWCALAYSFAGSWLAWVVGRPLIRLNSERYAREADLRFAVVRIHESAEAIALHRGETDERETMNGAITTVVTLGRQLANGLARLTWITSGYGWLALVVPVLVALPGYMYGDLSLGGLAMVVGAFNQVQQALRWFVDNISTIADWRATLLRVVTFRTGLVSLSEPEGNAGRIAVDYHPNGKLAFDNLGIVLPDGVAALEERFVEVARGERVFIAGCPEAGKNQLLRAMAGLWPSGTGTILQPPPQDVMYMPPRPYLPAATLQTAVTYPGDASRFDNAVVCDALKRVGLDRLIARLGDTDRWDKVLSTDEQQRLALARLLLHRPLWVFFEDTTTCLNEENCRLMRSIFGSELAGASVIGIGSSRALDGFYTRTLHIRGLQTAAYPLPRQNYWPVSRYHRAEVELQAS